MLHCVKCGKEIEDGVLCSDCTPEAGRCIHCGAQLRPGVAFCTACGKKQGKLTMKPEYCNKCGTKLGEEDQFCPECGAKIQNYNLSYSNVLNDVIYDMGNDTIDENLLENPLNNEKHKFSKLMLILTVMVVLISIPIIIDIKNQTSVEEDISVSDTLTTTAITTTAVTTTVYANNYDVEYLTGAKVQYDKEMQVYQIFFRLQDHNNQDIDAVGTANIKIVDNKYNVLYNREWDFDQADWTTITEYGNEYYGYWFEIPRDDVEKASGPQGTLFLNVSGTGFSFEQTDLDISDLPSIINVVETKYNWNTDCNWTISDLNYEIEEYEYDKSKVNLTVTCVVTLNNLGWGISDNQKLYFETRVIDSSNFVVHGDGYYDGYSKSVGVGEKSNVSFTIYGLAPSETYTIEFELSDQSY